MQSYYFIEWMEDILLAFHTSKLQHSSNRFYYHSKLFMRLTEIYSPKYHIKFFLVYQFWLTIRNQLSWDGLQSKLYFKALNLDASHHFYGDIISQKVFDRYKEQFYANQKVQSSKFIHISYETRTPWQDRPNLVQHYTHKQAVCWDADNKDGSSFHQSKNPTWFYPF